MLRMTPQLVREYAGKPPLGSRSRIALRHPWSNDPQYIIRRHERDAALAANLAAAVPLIERAARD